MWLRRWRGQVGGGGLTSPPPRHDGPLTGLVAFRRTCIIVIVQLLGEHTIFDTHYFFFFFFFTNRERITLLSLLQPRGALFATPVERMLGSTMSSGDCDSNDSHTTPPLSRQRSRTQATITPAGLHNTRKRKVAQNTPRCSGVVADRFIASRKNSRLDLDFKSSTGPSSVEFIRGTIQSHDQDCCDQPCCQWCGRGAMGVSPTGSLYKVATASVLLGLEDDTAELCRELETSCLESEPIKHHFTPRVLRFFGHTPSKSPKTIVPQVGFDSRRGGSPIFQPDRRGLPNLSTSAQHLLTKPFLRERRVVGKSYRSLDAPGLADDFYLSLVDWSPTAPCGDSFLAVGLGHLMYVQSQTGNGMYCLNDGTHSSARGPSTSATAGAIPRSASRVDAGFSTPRTRLRPISEDSDDSESGDGASHAQPLHGSSRSRSRTTDGRHMRTAITGVSWSKMHAHRLAVGHDSGLLQIWDVQRRSVVHTMAPGSGQSLFSPAASALEPQAETRRCQRRINSIAWLATNPNVCLFGRGSSFYAMDLRCGRASGSGEKDRWNGVVARYKAHNGEVCGLEVSPDDLMVASGSNDNSVALWDLRRAEGLSSSCTAGTLTANHRPFAHFTDHRAAVKAIAWSPHKRGVLATGGGATDCTIKIRNALHDPVPADGNHTIATGAQVCKLLWSRSTNEFVSAHGYSTNGVGSENDSSTNQIVVWRYSDFGRVATLADNDRRVVHMAMSPNGQDVVVGADEIIRFYNLFPESSTKKSWGTEKSAASPQSSRRSPVTKSKFKNRTPEVWNFGGSFAKHMQLR